MPTKLEYQRLQHGDNGGSGVNVEPWTSWQTGLLQCVLDRFASCTNDNCKPQSKPLTRTKDGLEFTSRYIYEKQKSLYYSTRSTYFVLRLALNVLRGSRFLEPTLNPFLPLPLLFRSFLSATKPMSPVKACLPSLGRRYSGMCFK